MSEVKRGKVVGADLLEGSMSDEEFALYRATAARDVQMHSQSVDARDNIRLVNGILIAKGEVPLTTDLPDLKPEEIAVIQHQACNTIMFGSKDSKPLAEQKIRLLSEFSRVQRGQSRR